MNLLIWDILVVKFIETGRRMVVLNVPGPIFFSFLRQTKYAIKFLIIYPDILDQQDGV